MKYRVHAGDRCFVHITGSSWDIRSWPLITMTKDAVYDDADVWFGRDHPSPTEMRKYQSPQLSNEAYIANNYGFRLPSNSKNIDCIVISGAAVDRTPWIERSSSDTLRRMHEQNGNYSFPGYIPRKIN